MADATLFDAVADALQARAGLDALAARGTLRIALKGAGLDARTVTPTQMQVVLERVLPHELESRGVGEAQGVCEALGEVVRAAEQAGSGSGAAAPEDVFRRIRERSAG
jgi:hypothetical protein